MEYPIEVNKIEFDKSSKILEPELLFGGKCGDFVSVRPCAGEYKDKTYLGVIIGGLSMGAHLRFEKETGTIKVSYGGHNPLIFIPEKSTTVMGCASWWGKIKSEDQLREITDDDISNVWYVQALKKLAEGGDDSE